MKRRVSKVLACLLAGMLTAAAADSAVFADPIFRNLRIITPYICPNSKILKEDETDYSDLTLCEDNIPLVFSAAANERESAQLIITDEDWVGTYKDFQIDLKGDLVCKENNHTISKDQFEIYFEHYVKAEQYWGLMGSHAGENGKVSYDSYPDALIPYDLAIDTNIPEEKRASTFTFDGEKKNQGLWFTVDVPAGTPAGTYKSTLKGTCIVSSQPAEMTIPVEVKVFDFELDTVTNSRTHFASYIGHLPTKKSYDNRYRVQHLKEIIGMSSEGEDDAAMKYDNVINSLLNKRKVSSGYNYGVFWGTNTLEQDIKALTDHIKSADTRAPYFNLCVGYFDYPTESGEGKARLKRYPSSENEIGLEMVMKGLVDQSITDQFDYLQYAYVYLPQDDEPPVASKDANVRTLVNSYILEDTKDAVKTYIESKTGIAAGLKNELLASVGNILYLHTVAPTEGSGDWSDILYQGVSAAPVEGEFSIEESYDYYDVETKQMQQYTVTIKANSDNDFRMNSFCPQFNDFSSSKGVNCTQNTQLGSKLASYQADGTDFWWYSTLCSGKSASVAGYMVNENHGINKADSGTETLNMDSLAVARANKWQQFNLGILGELYWGVDAFRFIYEAQYEGKHAKYSIPREVSCPYEPADTELVRNHQYLKTDIGITATGGDDYTASDGLLIYPVKQLLKNVYGIEDEDKLNTMAERYGYFCSSLRLENLSEANDDYDYLCLAEKLVKGYPEYRSRLNSIIQTVIEPGNVDYTDPELTNASNLNQARNLLAALIEGHFGNIREVTNDGVDNTFRAAADGVPVVKKWHTSNQVLCFDICETNTYQNSNAKRSATVTLATSDWKRLNQLMTIDFKTKTISRCEGAVLVPKGNGWYTVQIPLNNVQLNNSAGEEAAGDETLAMVFFDYRYVYRSFLAGNFRILKEVTNDGLNNTFTAAADGVPVVEHWKDSSQVLCFDVCETDHQDSNGKRRATLSLVNSDWKRLNQLITIDFEKKKIENCAGAILRPKENGWYTVQIPLSNVQPNTSEGEVASGDETITMVHFDKRYVFRSFLADNFRLLKEVTNDGLKNTFTMAADSVPVVNNWNNHSKLLCFDVCETDTHQDSSGKRRATVSLVNSDWKRLNQLITIDFEAKKVLYCPDAAMVPKGDGWYTVQIPLDKVLLNNSEGEIANGHETLTMVHFDKRYVYRSFYADHFRIKTAAEAGDLNGDGVLDRSDLTALQNYLTGNGALSQNIWAADLDRNGVINAVDLTLLKRMLLAQQ